MSLRSLFWAAAAAALLAACAAPPKPPEERSAAQYTDDATLSARVKHAIASGAGARTAAAIDVDAYRGVVSLSGFVDSDEQRKRAVDAASKVQGVRSVKNALRLKPA